MYIWQEVRMGLKPGPFEAKCHAPSMTSFIRTHSRKSLAFVLPPPREGL